MERFTDYLVAKGMATDVTSLTREHCEGFIVHLLDTRSPTTAVNRYKALQQYFRWLDDEGEITDSPMVKMPPPTLAGVEVPVVSLEDLRKLFDVCKGTSFDDRRDTALIRLFFDSGARLAEVAGLEVTDLDLRGYEVAHVRGKGGKHRALPMEPKTLKAMDGYLRRRASHKRWLTAVGGTVWRPEDWPAICSLLDDPTPLHSDEPRR